jgi:hypothetical protein
MIRGDDIPRTSSAYGYYLIIAALLLIAGALTSAWIRYIAYQEAVKVCGEKGRN